MNKENCKKIGEGAVSIAYLCDKNRILLKGKRKDSFESYQKLKNNLDLLNGKIKSIKIPSNAKIIEPCEKYSLGAISYLYVEGEELKNKIHDCSKEQKSEIGKRLAEFISEMQNINTSLNKDNEIEINNGKLKKAIELIKPYLNKEEIIKMEKVSMNYNNFMISSNFYITHGDLQEENLILDDNNNLVGIIDFGNMEYYVQEIEFDSMMNYDLDIFEAMLNNYKGQIEINNIKLIGLVRRVRFFKHILNNDNFDTLKEVEEIKTLLNNYEV